MQYCFFTKNVNFHIYAIPTYPLWGSTLLLQGSETQGDRPLLFESKGTTKKAQESSQWSPPFASSW